MIMIKPLPVTVNRQRGARIHLVFQGGLYCNGYIYETLFLFSRLKDTEAVPGGPCSGCRFIHSSPANLPWGLLCCRS